MTRSHAEHKSVALCLVDSHDYAAWLARVAKQDARTKSTIARLALAEWAERQGYEAPPHD